MVNGDMILNKISEALLTDYSSVYYVNAVTGEYKWYSLDPSYKLLQIESYGTDFFAKVIPDTNRVVYEEDRHILVEGLSKERLLTEVRKGSMQELVYRLVIEGQPVYYSLRLIRGVDENSDYFVLGVRNVDAEMRQQLENQKINAEREIFNQIAGSLASRYNAIYYVDIIDDSYIEFSSTDAYKHLNIPKEGNDFFNLSKQNIKKCIHEEDKGRMINAIDKDHIITMLETRKQVQADYRLIIDDKTLYTRLIAMWSGDKSHFIIAVENIDEQIQKEYEHLEALRVANELARRDDLTGVSNNTAMRELLKIIQSDIIQKKAMPFALIIFDVNDLKYVNDTYGHNAGDSVIKAACGKICKTFSHSPVFRFGGDEFAVILTGSDYIDRDELLRQFRITSESGSRDTIDNPVVASGLAAFEKETDKSVTDVFERADADMYENKKRLKGNQG